MSGWRLFLSEPVSSYVRLRQKRPPPAHFSFPLIYDCTSLTYFFEPVKSRVEPIFKFFEPILTPGCNSGGLRQKRPPPAHFSFPLIYDRTSLTYFFEPDKSRVEPIFKLGEALLNRARVTYILNRLRQKRPPPAHFSFPLIYDRTSLTYFFEPDKTRVEPICELGEPILTYLRVT